MMKIKSRLACTVSIVLSAALVFCGCGHPVLYDLTLVDYAEPLDFHTELQAQYLADDYTNAGDYAKGTAELSRPNPLHFEWNAAAKAKTDTSDSSNLIAEYTVEFSRTGMFNDALSFTTGESELDVYNLYIATDYAWRVTATLADGTKDAVSVGWFTTSDVAPRNLYVDGITNVRDLGGWMTADGSRVKQGMIYRCGRLNVSEQPEIEIEITEAGIKTMLDEMGVKSEIDLRNPQNHNVETGGITSSPLGDEVNYYNCAMEWNVSNILTDNVAEVKHVFKILADESNYPLIYHCNIGTDRTGLFAILVNGLLGVSESDLYRDYLFSNFGKINSARSLDGIKNTYMATIKKCNGGTLSEKIENCLLGLGVPQEHIDAVRDIMSE